MPRHDQSPPGADHQSHERLLLIRLAADDLSSAERPAAEALRAGCPACADLARDVDLISRVTASLPAPSRPRDFRISPEQARTARGTFIGRILERLAAPRLGILQPLGAAAVAIGFVLVVVGMGLPSMGGGSPAGAVPGLLGSADPSPAMHLTGSDAAPAEGAPDAAATGGGAAPAEADDGDSGALPRNSSGVPPSRAVASPASGPVVGGTDSATGGVSRNGTDAPSTKAEPSAVSGSQFEAAGSPAPPDLTAAEALKAAEAERGADERLAELEAGTARGTGLVTFGLLLGSIGLTLIILRVLSQRRARDQAVR